MTRYKVVGHCAHATVNTSHGRVRQLHFKGVLLPEDVPDSEIRHLVSVGLVAPVEVAEPASAPAASVVPVGEDGDTGDGWQDVDDGDPADDPGERDSDSAGSDGELEDAGQDAGDEASKPDPEVEAKRQAARAKLPTDGSRPHANAGQPVWVEYLVTKGYDYDTLVKADKKDLVETAGQLDR